MILRDLEHRRLGIWGAGKEGLSALNALRALFPGKALTVLNDAPLSERQEAALRQEGYAAAGNVTIRTGDSVRDAMSECDVIIKSPSVCPYRDDIKQAARAGTVFTSGVQLWFNEHCDEKTVAITGTKGKTTTTSLVAHMLNRHGIPAIAAGNLGSPLLDYMHVKNLPQVWVIELSSYQLTDADIFPSVAVLLNLYPEHINWHGSIDVYYRDKLNVFKHTRPGRAVINRDDANTRELCAGLDRPVYFNDRRAIHYRDGGIWCADSPLVGPASIPLRGAHNLSNICAALTAIKVLGFNPEAAASHIATFPGIPHRLQAIGEIAGVLCVDDSISTIPQSAVAALEVYRDRPVTLLMGGHDRGLDYAPLVAYLSAHPATVIAMPDNGKRIAETLRAANICTENIHEVAGLEDAVALARGITPPGGVILLSPAAPSYGHFTNYEERGDAFKAFCGL